jgi:signal transduction histidine kinase
MVKNIIESANGEISFVSEKGEGTTFCVSLPIIEKVNS